MRRLGRLAYWLAPLALCLALYWPGFRAWFQQDDFVWLALDRSLASVGGLKGALFAPLAQGTLRPLSERAFFLVAHGLFGNWASPYHAAVFATQFGALVLLAAVARRLTGSKLAGFLAPVFWVTNGGLIVTLSWVSAYNQVLCAFFLLAAFYCLERHSETGERRWLAGQWAAFLLGLGSLEIMAVYPVLAALWAWSTNRKYLRKTVPLFAALLLYLVVHYRKAPYQSTDPAYVLHFSSSMLATFWTYWKTALGPAGLTNFFPAFPPPLVRAGTLLLSIGILAFAGFALVRARREAGRSGADDRLSSSALADRKKRRSAPLFGLAWFLITLAPVLPLRDHVSPYYLTIPAIGLALTGAAAVAASFRSGRWRLAGAAVVLAGIYVACGAVEARLGSAAVRDHSFRVRTLVLGACRAHQLHPDKALVFAGVDELLFWTGFYHNPFPLWGVPEIYVDPLSARQIRTRPGAERMNEFLVPGPFLRQALEARQAVVYELDDGRLRSRTLSYLMQARELWPAGDPSRVDVGKRLYASQLGPAWHDLEENRRWMPRVATLRLAGPRESGERLYIEGWCPPEQVAQGPLRVDVAVAGVPLPDIALLRGAGPFRAAFRLPETLVGRSSVEVLIAVDKTFWAAGDRRDLGLIFGSFEIRR